MSLSRSLLGAIDSAQRDVVTMRCLLLTLERAEDDRDVSAPCRTLAAFLERRGWAIEALCIPASGRPGDNLEPLGPLLDRVRPEVVVVRGLGPTARDVLAQVRDAGAASVLMVGEAIEDDYYREAYALECTVLPNLVDPGRVVADDREPTYLTFVNPSVEEGVYAFARIADELGRRRPDIPILVVEGRGTEATVAACGLDLRAHGNVFFLANTHDPRRFWRVAKLCLLPSLWWENQPLVAVEAMLNGIPVVGSDRGGIPETLGGAGVVLSLPERITPATRWLPTADEVAPWVEAVFRLWDDADSYEDHRRRARVEARRWDPGELGARYARFFEGLRPGDLTGGSATVPCPRPGRWAAGGSMGTTPPGRAKAVVLVPHLAGVEEECEDALRRLEREGVLVVRRRGSLAIDVARNEMASDALHDGFESILFIDADLGFDPRDALRLLARPEAVVSGVYAKKGLRELASRFADGIAEVRFGTAAFGLYPLKYAATGFLRLRAPVLRRMVEALELPLCNTRWGRGSWPFFLPVVVPDGDGGHHYLGEDWPFSHRLSRIGVTPMADTSIRLWHYGRHAYGWEDAGRDAPRYGAFTYHMTGP